jgi:predicted Zn finger-like uncharacterized protein
MKIICPSCGADFQLNPEQMLGDGLQIKCPACLHVFMAYADGSTASVGDVTEAASGQATESLLPPPPPPPPRKSQPSVPPPVPSFESTGSSDVFDFSFGSSTASPPEIEQAAADVQDAGDDFDFSFGIQNETVPPVAKPEPASPLGNLFDDLEDLPQPKVEAAELPTPKVSIDLPGLPEEQTNEPEPASVEPSDLAASLQAPDFVRETPQQPVSTAPLPEAPKPIERKGAGPLYLVLGGMILLGVVCTALYFGGLSEESEGVVTTPTSTPVVAKNVVKTPPPKREQALVTLAQIAGFMNKLETLEINVKEEDPKTQADLDTYTALACLQFRDHRYFCANAKTALGKLKEGDQSPRALALRLTQNDLDARRLVAEGAKANPKDGLWHMLAGYAAEQVGELEAAVNHFATAYELQPEFEQTIRVSTEISIRRGDYEGAEASLSYLEKMIPSSFPALYLRGKLESEKIEGDVKRAMQALDEAAALSPVVVRKGDLALVHELRAKLFRRAGKDEETIAALSKAARLSPGNEQLLALLGSIYFERNEYDPALMQIRQLEKDGKTTPQLLMLKADCYLRMGQRKKANSIVQAAKKQFPKSAAVRLFEGDILTSASKYRDAEQAYSKAIELRPFDVSIQLKLATLLMAQSKIEQAKTLLEEKLKVDPNAPKLLVGYARIRKELGDVGGGKADYEPARIHYARALKQDASANDVRLEYIDVLLKIGATKEADAALDRVKSEGHLKAAVAYLTARVLAQQSKYVDSFKFYEQAQAEYDQDAQFLVHMASVAFENNMYEQAMSLLDQARLIDNKRSDIYHLLGKTAFHQSSYDTAIRYLKQAIKLDGQNTGHRYWLARAHLQRNETAKASRELDRIIREVAPNKTLATVECDAFFLRAQMLRADGLSSWSKAIKLLDRHTECAPKHAESYLVRGRIHADYRSLDQARQDFKQASKLALSAKQQKIAAMALYEAAKVLKRRPRFSQANLLALLKDAVKADASYAPPHRDLCTMLHQAEPKRAKGHCKAYLSAAPKGLYAGEVRELLRNL